jgi:uncharacterized coiled-coil protein SlyX
MSSTKKPEKTRIRSLSTFNQDFVKRLEKHWFLWRLYALSLASTLRRMSNLDSDQRLIALEEKLSYQQRQLEELNQVIVEQHAQVLQLSREVRVLTDTVKGILENGGENYPHEKPPHY